MSSGLPMKHGTLSCTVLGATESRPSSPFELFPPACSIIYAIGADLYTSWRFPFGWTSLSAGYAKMPPYVSVLCTCKWLSRSVRQTNSNPHNESDQNENQIKTNSHRQLTIQYICGRYRTMPSSIIRRTEVKKHDRNCDTISDNMLTFVCTSAQFVPCLLSKLSCILWIYHPTPLHKPRYSYIYCHVLVSSYLDASAQIH